MVRSDQTQNDESNRNSYATKYVYTQETNKNRYVKLLISVFLLFSNQNCKHHHIPFKVEFVFIESSFKYKSNSKSGGKDVPVQK